MIDKSFQQLLFDATLSTSLRSANLLVGLFQLLSSGNEFVM